ncbi:hypothetical protein ACTL6U_04700 [Rhodovibrionaceae bacterium A322]
MTRSSYVQSLQLSSGLPLPPQPYEVDFLGGTRASGSTDHTEQQSPPAALIPGFRNRLADILMTLSQRIRATPKIDSAVLERA